MEPSAEPPPLRVDWTRETKAEGLQAFAHQLMLAGTGLPVRTTVPRLRPYAEAFAELGRDPGAQTFAAWSLAEEVNKMLREANRRERLYRESEHSPTWRLLTPEQAMVLANEGRPVLERAPSPFGDKGRWIALELTARFVELGAYLGALVWARVWLLLAIVVALEVAIGQASKRVEKLRLPLAILSRLGPLAALLWSGQPRLAAAVTGVSVVTLLLRWRLRGALPQPPPAEPDDPA